MNCSQFSQYQNTIQQTKYIKTSYCKSIKIQLQTLFQIHWIKYLRHAVLSTLICSSLLMRNMVTVGRSNNEKATITHMQTHTYTVHMLHAHTHAQKCSLHTLTHTHCQTIEESSEAAMRGHTPPTAEQSCLCVSHFSFHSFSFSPSPFILSLFAAYRTDDGSLFH